MPRFAKALTLPEVKERLFARLNQGADEPFDEALPNDARFSWDHFLNQIHGEPAFQAVLAQDLGKVAFDLENIGVVEVPHGPFVLVHGVPMLFAWAGGDWEWPVHFFLYIDPRNALRGYLPKDGNRYNRATKQAYGNDDSDDGDAADLRKHFGTDDWDYAVTDEEYAAMVADATGRIQVP